MNNLLLFHFIIIEIDKTRDEMSLVSCWCTYPPKIVDTHLKKRERNVVQQCMSILKRDTTSINQKTITHQQVNNPITDPRIHPLSHPTIHLASQLHPPANTP